jgi:C1A family cysteine protease
LALPEEVDLRAKCSPVVDQGQLGSCTANAIAGALDFERGRQGLPFIAPSRLFIYYNERAIEGTVSSDSGAQIRDGIKSVASQGAPPEVDWSYNPSLFAVRPPRWDYRIALGDRCLAYDLIPQTTQFFEANLAAGFPFVFGFSVYESFESQEVATTGIVPMPGRDDAPIGGHAVMCAGYKPGWFLCRNSWGVDWGMSGYFWMPAAYLMNAGLASDFWTLKLVSK